MNKDIIAIADTQQHDEAPDEHIHALAKYIWKHKPSRIVHMGDNWDFPSLSTFNTPLEAEGRRLGDDLNAGALALGIIPNYINHKNSVAKKKHYKPEFDFITGNHEMRLKRMIDNNPHLEGLIDLDKWIVDNGWTVHKFLEPLWIDGVAFSHFMQNPMTGRPIGGSIENKLNKHTHSFVHAHQQQFQYGRRQTLDGSPMFGACAGAFYLHDESYRGAYNTEIRGFIHLKHFINRYGFDDYDVNFVSLERLMENY